MTTFDQLTEEDVTARTNGAAEVPWLRDRRLEAFKRFVDQRWPDSTEDEYWRSTPFDRRFDTGVEIVTDHGDPTTVPGGLATEYDGPVALARVLDGTVVETSVPEELAAAGVVVADLRRAAAEHPEVVREHLGSLTTCEREGTGADDDRTVTLSDAAWTGGVLVHVPADLELDGLVVVQVHVTRPGGHLPRVLVVAEHNSRSSVAVEHTAAPLEAPAVVDEVVEAVVLDGARLDLVTLNEWGRGGEGDEVAHLSLQKAAVHRDATYRHLSVTVGGTTVRLRPEVDLVGPGASCEPLGIYYADEGQHFDLQPYIRHIAPHAVSDTTYKGALQGHSRTVFRGNVLVGEEARGTETDENNRSLILTDGARADSTPFLEILCSDVTAGHGSATGQVDSRHLFYAQSRGISREEALRLIVYGFFREVLERLGLPVIERRALAHIEHEIEAADLSSIGVTSPVTIGESV